MLKACRPVVTSEYLKELAQELGATLIGFGDVSYKLAGELKHLSYAISIAISDSPVEVVKTPRFIAYSNQSVGLDVKLESIQKKLVFLLRSCGHKCLAIPPDSLRKDNRFIARLYSLFPHKTAATCSGLGWVGKSGLLINEQYGPRLSWATILTDMPPENIGRPYYASQCGGCSICVRACPVGAIENTDWIRGATKPVVNYLICSQNLQRNKQIIGKAICGLCVLACPVGQGKGSKEASIW
ncbi:MAG: 4Fe-4S binding protein [Firmicutes bacterium]|nr:4Fe-4S binding protein [Bacillota bacterium]